MTKNRARKQAARQRAAITGERYVVARRAADDLQPSTSRLHDLLHRVPGVPAHVAGGLQAVASRRPRPGPTGRHHGRTNRQHGEPRVVVGLQGWIARRVGFEQK